MTHMRNQPPDNPRPERPRVEPEILPPDGDEPIGRGMPPRMFVFVDREGRTRFASFRPPGPLTLVLALRHTRRHRRVDPGAAARLRADMDSRRRAGGGGAGVLQPDPGCVAATDRTGVTFHGAYTPLHEIRPVCSSSCVIDWSLQSGDDDPRDYRPHAPQKEVPMRHLMTRTTTIAVVGALLLATLAPATAQVARPQAVQAAAAADDAITPVRWRGRRGAAIGAGIFAGALLGAGIAASRPYYGPGPYYYGPGYYAPPPVGMRRRRSMATRSPTACAASSRTTRPAAPIWAMTATVIPVRSSAPPVVAA